MTALVYLRSSFGFVFLRPKSVFFAFSWAFLLFVIFAHYYPNLWREYWAICVLGTGTIALYWLHLLVAFTRELYRAGEHDHYSGTSHALRIMQRFGLGSAVTEKNIHLWGEPVLVLVTSGVFRLAFAETHLSAWLVFVAACMVCKEAMNYWTDVRRDKIKEDMIRDAEEQAGTLPDNHPTAEIPKPTRKAAVERQRDSRSADETARERRFAELLRLRQPYSLDKAEENYVTLVRLEHPDTHKNSPESNARTAELNEAIEFFRQKLAAESLLTPYFEMLASLTNQLLMNLKIAARGG